MRAIRNFVYTFSIFLASISFFSFSALAVPGTWHGYVYANTTLGENALPVTAYILGVSKDNTSTTTSESRGWYILQVEGNAGDKVGFQACGVNVNQENQTWSAGPHYNGSYTGPLSTEFNLSFSRQADSASCTYACGCTGGFCNSGSCASSAPTTTTVGGGDGGGGGGGTTTTTVATTTTAATTTTITTTTTTTTIIVTQTVPEIPANTPTEIKLPASESTAVESITVQTTTAASNVQVTVKTTSAPSGASTIISSSAGAVYRYLDIKAVNVETSAVTSAKFKFKVERAWFTANEIDQTTVNLNRLVSNNWVKLATGIVGGDDKYVFYESESGGFSVFAITGEKVKPGATTTTVPIPTTTAKPTTTIATTTTAPQAGGTGIIIVVIVVMILIAAYFYMRKK